MRNFGITGVTGCTGRDTDSIEVEKMEKGFGGSVGNGKADMPGKAMGGEAVE